MFHIINMYSRSLSFSFFSLARRQQQQQQQHQEYAYIAFHQEKEFFLSIVTQNGTSFTQQTIGGSMFAAVALSMGRVPSTGQ